MNDTMTDGNVNSSDINTSNLGGRSGMGNVNNNSSSVRAASIYDICHPLVM